MNFLTSCLWAFICIPYALSAPASPNVSDDCRQNTLDAQILNAEFQTLNVTDPCNSNQIACIAGVPASCQFGSWQLKPCTDDLQCFAVPQKTGRGTMLACASEADVAQLFKDAGVPGGIANTNANRTVTFPTLDPVVSQGTASQSASVSQTSSTPTSLPSSQSIRPTDGVAIVTVTITVPASFSTSMPTQVQTIDSSEAMSIIESLISNGGSIIAPTSVPTSASIATALPEKAATSAVRPGHCNMATSATVSSATNRAAQTPSVGYYRHRRSSSVGQSRRRA